MSEATIRAIWWVSVVVQCVLGVILEVVGP